jgi:hypothetical protein
MSPYQQQVQQNTLRTMQRQAQINQGAVNDQAGAAKAFGGDRHGIVAAEQAKNDAQQQGDYVAQSNEAAYQQGQQQYNQDRAMSVAAQQGDRDAALQASGILGQLGNTSAGIASSDVQRLLQSGLSAQDDCSRGGRRAYQEYLRQQNAPMDRFSQLGGILAGTPYSSSSTQKQPGSIMNTIMGGAGLAASIFSDNRLKDNIVATGDDWHGLPVFEFDYKNMDDMELPAGRHRGVMAQDAILEYPEAVSAWVIMATCRSTTATSRGATFNEPWVHSRQHQPNRWHRQRQWPVRQAVRWPPRRRWPAARSAGPERVCSAASRSTAYATRVPRRQPRTQRPPSLNKWAGCTAWRSGVSPTCKVFWPACR